MKPNKLSKALDNLDEASMQATQETAHLITDTLTMIANKLHINVETLNGIINGDYDAHVVFSKPRRTIGTYAKSLSMIAVVVLLIVCIGVPGFSDNLRYTLLYHFTHQISTRVESITYDKYNDDIKGCVLPASMLEGYTISVFTRPNDTKLVQATYTNDAGNRIEYFYYPSNTFSSYDNEKTVFEELQLKTGTAYVGHTNKGTTIMYFNSIYGGFVHMEFDADITEQELKDIGNNMRMVQ